MEPKKPKKGFLGTLLDGIGSVDPKLAENAAKGVADVGKIFGQLTEAIAVSPEERQRQINELVANAEERGAAHATALAEIDRAEAVTEATHIALQEGLIAVEAIKKNAALAQEKAVAEAVKEVRAQADAAQARAITQAITATKTEAGFVQAKAVEQALAQQAHVHSEIVTKIMAEDLETLKKAVEQAVVVMGNVAENDVALAVKTAKAEAERIEEAHAAEAKAKHEKQLRETIDEVTTRVKGEDLAAAQASFDSRNPVQKALLWIARVPRPS